LSLAVLAFDCSTSACSAAVVRNGEVLAHRFAAMARGQSEALMPMIEDCLAEAGLAWSEIGLVGVTVGPGTFTGLRIGLAAARGIALAGKIPLAGVTTCEAVAHAVPAEERQGRTILAAIDGKRADVFVQPFSESLEPLAAPDALMPEDCARLFIGAVLLTGDAADRLAEAMPEAARSSASGIPDARVVARLAYDRWQAGTALEPTPLYIRPPDVTLPAAPK
jgi:tRNA threonylcarbamoyladenosine biosynthesis protein TsaB